MVFIGKPRRNRVRICAFIPETSVRDPVEVKFIEKMKFIKTHRICVHMVPMSFPTWSRYRLGAGFGLVIGCTSVPRSEVECCASNHSNISSKCYHTFPGIRELLWQMGSGLVVTKWVLINNTKIRYNPIIIRSYVFHPRVFHQVLVIRSLREHIVAYDDYKAA